MDKTTFVQIMRRAAPKNLTFQNPGDGTSKIISHSNTAIYYQRGKSPISIGYEALFDVWNIFQGKLVNSTELRDHNPSVFDSNKNGHSCNCTFLFLIFEAAGLVDEIEGKGVRGNPYGALILSVAKEPGEQAAGKGSISRSSVGTEAAQSGISLLRKGPSKALVNSFPVR